jgi:hypothetical protein
MEIAAVNQPLASLLAFVALAIGGYANPVGAAPAFDPDSQRILQGMSDFIAATPAFTVRTESSLEVVTRNGEKLQFLTPVSASVRRPDRLFSTREGDLVDQRFYYDGKSLTLFNPAQNVYATVPAPPTLDAAIDYARVELDIVAPAGDLIGTNAYAALTEDMYESRYLGMSTVAGQRCHHLAFRGNEVDFQIWVEDGKRPLPWRFVITSKKVAGAPQFATQIVAWDLKPRLRDKDFEFTAPKGAMGIDFVRAATPSP